MKTIIEVKFSVEVEHDRIAGVDEAISSLSASVRNLKGMFYSNICGSGNYNTIQDKVSFTTSKTNYCQNDHRTT